MTDGALIIVSGPSGAGKGTLVKRICTMMPSVWVSVSATTRRPRPGEVEGVSYFFLSPEEFQARVDDGDFLEWAEVHGNRYGTLRSTVDDRLRHGIDVLLEIDPQGALQVKELMPSSTLVFVTAPSFKELERRIRLRGAENDDEVRTRLETAVGELRLVEKYDHVIQNDDVSRAASELAHIIRSLHSDKGSH